MAEDNPINHLSPVVLIFGGLTFMGIALFSRMDRLRDGTVVTDPKKKLLLRVFFFVLGLLVAVLGISLEF